MAHRESRFVFSLFLNIASVGISLAISFFLTPYLLSVLGKEAYSFFPIANDFVNYMTIISLAVNSMASRFITVSLAEGNELQSKRYYSTVFFANCVIAGVLIIPSTVIVVFLEHILQIPAYLTAEAKVMFAFIFAALVLNLVTSVFGTATFARERMDLAGLLSIAQQVLRVGLYVLLFTIWKPTLSVMGITTLAIAALTGLVNWGFARRLLPAYRIRLDLFQREALRILLASGIWSSVYSLGSSLLRSMSLVLTNMLINAETAGNVSIAQTLPHIMTAIISAVYGVILPRITTVYAAKDGSKTKETVELGQKILGIVTSVPAVMILVFGKYFFRLWVPGEDAEYLHLLSIFCMLPSLMHSAMWPIFGLNVANNKLKKPGISLLVTGVVNVALTVLLVKLTPLGVYAILGVNVVLNFLYYCIYIPYYASKEMGISPRNFYVHIAKTSVYAAIVLAIFPPVLARFSPDRWIPFFVSAAVAELTGVLLYAVIVLTPQDWAAMFARIKRKG